MFNDRKYYDSVDLSDMGEFHEYVTDFDHNELIEIIEQRYLKIKNNCKYAPKLGENGCLEFAAGLLLHAHLTELLVYMRYDEAYNEQDKHEVIEKLMEVTFIIGTAFMGASPREWSNSADMLYENTSLLTKKEWSVVYLYLRDYHADDIRRMEFNEGNMYSNSVNKDKVLRIMSCKDMEFAKNYFVSQGLLMW